MKNRADQRQNQLISFIVGAVSIVFIYACTNDFRQCNPPIPDQNIIGKWNYSSTFVFGRDTTIPDYKPNFTGVISFDKAGSVDDPYHLFITRFGGKQVERKLYWFSKDTLHIAFLNKQDTLHSIDALLYTNECNGMSFGNWFAAKYNDPTRLVTLSR
jgi:hypothetical protein